MVNGYTILHENRYRKQYCSDYYFEKLEDAVKHLSVSGYIENNRIFYKGNSKAYIQPLKKYN